jgi:hypothetical protein
MDIYLNYRGANDSNQVLEEFSGFHLLIQEGCQIIEGKSGNDIMNVSINTDTHACGICWYVWRQVKDVVNFIDDFMNVKNVFIDGFQTLEKSNSGYS